MKRKNPPGTQEYIDQHGKPRFYLRRPGHNKISLPGLPWSPEFMEAREIALKSDGAMIEIGASKTVSGTVNAAIVAYLVSPMFGNGLADSTKQARRAILETFRAEHGDKAHCLDACDGNAEHHQQEDGDVSA
jgi:hypothetical protein